MALVLAVASSEIHVFLALLIAGAVIGVFGHIIHSRLLIVTGILVIALVSAYFEFVVAKVT